MGYNQVPFEVIKITPVILCPCVDHIGVIEQNI
jgi:hypothetical protein